MSRVGKDGLSVLPRHYNAVIDMISEDKGTCSVTFEGYGTTEIVKVCERGREGERVGGRYGGKESLLTVCTMSGCSCQIFGLRVRRVR